MVTSGRRALDVADVVDAVLHHYWQLVGHGQRYLGGRSEACISTWHFDEYVASAWHNLMISEVQLDKACLQLHMPGNKMTLTVPDDHAHTCKAKNTKTLALSL